MRRLALIFLLIAIPAQTAEPLLLRYPRAESELDTRMVYPLQLLQLGFEKAGVTVQLHASERVMEQNRALKELAQRLEVDVVWTMTSKEREASLFPVRIPIFKGLIGWRVALVSKKRASLLASIQNIEQLRHVIAVQGHDWPDTLVLRHNQLPISTASNYESLFKMLASQRVDYFPRAVTEIEPEWRAHQNLALHIDEHLLLYYPTAAYFFFHPQQQALAATLQKGLNLAIADGSFDRLFNQFFEPTIKALHLSERRIIKLDNPELPEATPLDRKALWFDPAH